MVKRAVFISARPPAAAAASPVRLVVPDQVTLDLAAMSKLGEMVRELRRLALLLEIHTGVEVSDKDLDGE